LKAGYYKLRGLANLDAIAARRYRDTGITEAEVAAYLRNFIYRLAPPRSARSKSSRGCSRVSVRSQNVTHPVVAVGLYFG
jgi:hypothetical protein